MNPPGYCRWCSNPSWDSDICDRCADRMDHEDEHPPRRRRLAPVSTVPSGYDPETDPF